MKKRLVCGVGINDADYETTNSIKVVGVYTKGRQKRKVVWTCKYWKVWVSMIERCYSDSFHIKNPTYKGCTVKDEWLTFSNFKSWMETQDYEGKCLDKDILKYGNKQYCATYCVFVDTKVNSFITACGKTRGEFLIGCDLRKTGGNFQSRCSNPFTGNRDNLGHYSTEVEAHLAWKKRKHEYAYKLANSWYVTDERVAKALRRRYKNYNKLEDHIR